MDREKVIRCLEICLNESNVCGSMCEQCQYESDYNRHCHENLMYDALELLKEQEAVEPILIREGRNKNYNDYVCPCCDNEVVYEQNYCSECGVKFMWEGR